MTVRTAATALLAAALTATAAQAEPSTADFDVKCVMVLNAVAAQVKPEQRKEVEGAALYFLGRIDSRTPAVDADAVAKKVGPTINNETGKAAVNQCMGMFGRRIQQVAAKAKAAAPAVPPKKK